MPPPLPHMPCKSRCNGKAAADNQSDSLSMQIPHREPPPISRYAAAPRSAAHRNHKFEAVAFRTVCRQKYM